MVHVFRRRKVAVRSMNVSEGLDSRTIRYPKIIFKCIRSDEGMVVQLLPFLVYYPVFFRIFLTSAEEIWYFH